ncbi:MAG: UDP-3-O-(3-hydroxymyristoyl)glucosamine N-acyltransferase [Caulobacteraceae bacterium]
MIHKGIADSRFYRRQGPYTAAQLATAIGSPCPNSEAMISGVAPLQNAAASDISFLDGARYKRLLQDTGAGAVIVEPSLADCVPATAVAIFTASAPEAWAKVVRLFHPLPPISPGRDPTAFVAPGARVDETAEIGPFAYIGDGVEIGAGCVIGPHVVLREGVVVGEDSRIGAGCVVSHAVIGAGSCLHSGVLVGQEGFGLARTSEGLRTVPHLGRAVIGSDVEIGAGCTIDRGSLDDTVIGDGCRLDNLVHIAHNVKLGRGCVIVAQVCIAGSTVLEDFVQVGGQSAIAGHLRIGAGAQIAGKSGVMSDLEPGAVVFGVPAQPKIQAFRQLAWLRRMSSEPKR